MIEQLQHTVHRMKLQMQRLKAGWVGLRSARRASRGQAGDAPNTFQAAQAATRPGGQGAWTLGRLDGTAAALSGTQAGSQPSSPAAGIKSIARQHHEQRCWERVNGRQVQNAQLAKA